MNFKLNVDNCFKYRKHIFLDGENGQFNFRNNAFDPTMMTDMQAMQRNYPGILLDQFYISSEG